MSSTQPAALPPKLQQLLASMPDVDKVKLMQIAHQYKMDLDDPGFLPLLLTQQGISALEQAKAEMVLELDRSLDRVATRIVEASATEAARLKEYSATLASYIKKTAADEDEKLRAGIAGWACGPLCDDLFNTLNGHLESTASLTVNVARQQAEAAASQFVAATTAAATQARAAGQAVETAGALAIESAKASNTWLFVAAFLGGGLAGALGLELIKRFF